MKVLGGSNLLLLFYCLITLSIPGIFFCTKFLCWWRFHLVHHTDLDLNITTAFRFHFGELIASVFFRGAAILLIGVTPAMVLIHEIAFEAATQFHHSNLKIPFRFEKFLNKML